MNELQSQFHKDGVVFIQGALDRNTLKLAEAAFDWTFNNPGPGAGDLLIGTPGTFYQDQANPDCFDAYHELLQDTCIPDLVAGLWESNSVWFLYEQIWFKDGGNTRRTPWHQDLPYLPVEGDDLGVLWTNLDPVTQDTSLELVQGSHRGPLFNPTAFNPDDVSAALFDEGVLSEEKWAGRRAQLAWLVHQPGFSGYWDAYGQQYARGFAAAVEAELPSRHRSA